MEPLEKTPAPVKTLILICEKCGKKLIEEGQDNPSLVIQKNLKSRIKQELPLGMARAITTSCMNICPSGAITIAKIASLSENTDAQFYILHEKEANKAADLIFDEFLGS